MDPTPVEAIIQTLIEKLKAYYVFPDTAEKIFTHLQKGLADGEFNPHGESKALADALTTELQEISGDKHLAVWWSEEPLPEHEGSMLQNEDFNARMRQIGKDDNYGIHKVEWLPGNIGYLKIDHFVRTSWGSGETIAAAMNFIANVNVLIVDLRECTGGNPYVVAMFSSYFFGQNPIHLNSLYWRAEDTTEQYWTLPHVPGKRMEDTPIYILTSEKTFSAGEEFAYNLQALKRATLVGEATAGGAHPGSPYRIHPHFEVFIPNGRAINPITSDNWEGAGVQPDIPIENQKAMNTAYKLALENVIQNLGQPDSGPSKRLLEQAQLALVELEDE